ncbi:urease accessory protein UreD [Vineibacter terrae]|uniref:urease accessory protein UreD n=1 Tax=Vineibacter terrae TaxID=2586908 RepID=UPI002E33EFAD|nr:urease accessory protein UreD [Vineibacter terrae]HEX2892207.1 urease accessory protein UreD [Vineibacter terrae]
MKLQRGDGAASVAYALGPQGTALADLYQRDPCRVLFPHGEPGDPPQAVFVTMSGGLADGDRLRLQARLHAGAVATATTQAAEKIYRASPAAADCVIDVAASVAAGAALEWLPQETILFDGARLRRRTVVDIAAGGRLLACEMVVLGRIASGERFTSGLLLDAWRVRRDGRLVWADALRLDAAAPVAAGFGDATSVAMALYVADDAARHLEAARSALPSDVKAGATVVNGLLLARFLGAPLPVRRGLASWLADMRSVCLDLPPRLPRVWHV